LEHQLHNAGQRGLGTRLKMMVASAGVRKAVFVCLLAFVFTVATGFSVVNYKSEFLAKCVTNFFRIFLFYDIDDIYRVSHQNPTTFASNKTFFVIARLSKI
jgi:hypothetical protein